MSESNGQAESVKNIIIGTAGHIDHGKTTLISALTGEDTDRLKEEKERGISIDLGFTDLKLSESIRAGIIDAPGHEKFVKNMLAGAGGVDLALLVIAADEGVMPQTREHLAILELLSVERGVIAVSKTDTVDDEWLELVVSDIRDQLQDSFLAEAPLVKVSGVEKQGLDQLKNKLLEQAEKIPAKDAESSTYMPVDRVFTLKGYGTIVTGTLFSGTLKTGENLSLFPREKEVRIRSLQVHNEQRDTALPGERVGVNLAGIDRGEVERGDVLAEPGSLTSTRFIDCRLNLLPSAPLILEHGTRIRFHIGAREVIGRAYMIDKEEIFPGESGLVQYRLEEKVVARHLEDYVVRRYSPVTTIGGGEVIESNPPRRKKLDEEAARELEIKEQGSPAERLTLHLELSEAPLSRSEIKKELGFSQTRLNGLLEKLEKEKRIVRLDRYQDPRWMEFSIYEELRGEIESKLSDYHSRYPLRRGVSRAELRSQISYRANINELREITEIMEKEGRLDLEDEYISLDGFEVEFFDEAEKLKEKILEEFEKDKFTPPDRQDLGEKYGQEYGENLLSEVINALEEKNDLTRVAENIYFSTEAVKLAQKRLREYLQENESIEVAEFRDILNSSRKYSLPLLEYFDQKGFTIRKGDKRYLSGEKSR
ncbi:selenocysteine-specific translation elongation factor [Halarsenatibacter silvermanii]|uniref:Selenocysteine-specific elongation factor n=1 Tax=Halarsenatibacter silvermanii TaxID=321763 RepID=A0A1G9SPG5_9FIRM|nr:selenocysteine-specific translation elongation factor [Halarsenatibacter silvermanii]SDM37373.1 selenocysteine-specific elongation factor [Halarsenatibacter silvermanii]